MSPDRDRLPDSGRARAVALVSGGLDSTVSLAVAAGSYDLAEALFFDYGQLSADRERLASVAIAGFYAIPLRVIEFPWLGRVSASGLTSGDIPDLSEIGGPGSERDMPRGYDSDSAGAVWVENRNALFVNVAAVFAASAGRRGGKREKRGPGASDIKGVPPAAGADGSSIHGVPPAAGPVRIITGFNREEAKTFPDNSAAFVRAANELLAISVGSPVTVEAPTLAMDKREIVAEGIRLGVPWEMIWSCYRGGERMCGRCESCRRLEAAVRGTEVEERIVFE